MTVSPTATIIHIQTAPSRLGTGFDHPGVHDETRDTALHTFQTVEAAFQQNELLKGGLDTSAAARYLGAHTPTMRAQRDFI